MASIFGKRIKNDYNANNSIPQDNDSFYDASVSDSFGSDIFEPDMADDTRIATGRSMSVGDNGAAVALKVIKPKSFKDGPDIVDYVASGSTVVLNIEKLSRTDTLRLIDYIQGALHVIGGDMKKVTDTTLVIAPGALDNDDDEDYEDEDEFSTEEEIIEDTVISDSDNSFFA